MFSLSRGRARACGLVFALVAFGIVGAVASAWAPKPASVIALHSTAQIIPAAEPTMITVAER